MIKLFKQIPIITRSIIVISLGLYLVNVILYFMGIHINDYIGLWQFSNENFRPYQVLTFTFSHDVYPDHFLYNSSYLLIFLAQIELILKKKTLGLIIFTIFFSILGLQFFTQNGHHVGLSIVGFSSISFFVLSKNYLNQIISLPLKLMGMLAISGEILSFMGYLKNGITPDPFFSNYAHVLGILSGFIFYLLVRIKQKT